MKKAAAEIDLEPPTDIELSFSEDFDTRCGFDMDGQFIFIWYSQWFGYNIIPYFLADSFFIQGFDFFNEDAKNSKVPGTQWDHFIFQSLAKLVACFRNTDFEYPGNIFLEAKQFAVIHFL